MYLKKQKQKGFTLIEMMIVVAILGIVSAIAVPSYMDYVTKGKRTDAKVELLRMAQLQESYFVQNLSYAKDFTSATNAGGLGLTGPIESEQGEYTILLNPTPAGCGGTSVSPCTGFTLTADAGTIQSNDAKCLDFTLTNTGVKGVTGAHSATPRDCW